MFYTDDALDFILRYISSWSPSYTFLPRYILGTYVEGPSNPVLGDCFVVRVLQKDESWIILLRAFITSWSHGFSPRKVLMRLNAPVSTTSTICFRCPWRYVCRGPWWKLYIEWSSKEPVKDFLFTFYKVNTELGSTLVNLLAYILPGPTSKGLS